MCVHKAYLRDSNEMDTVKINAIAWQASLVVHNSQVIK